MGSTACRSRHTSSAKQATEAPASIQVPGRVQPSREDSSVSTRMAKTVPPTISAAPAKSMRWWTTRFGRRSAVAMSASATAPIGRLM